MNAWYISQERFNNRIIKNWKRRGFDYNPGHVQLLRFSFRCLLYHASLKSEKVSQVNRVNCEPSLF